MSFGVPNRTRRVFLLGGGLTVLAACIGASEIRRDMHDQLAEIERRLGGRLGIAAHNTQTGARILYRADERFAMASTFKLALAAAVLRKNVDSGRTDPLAGPSPSRDRDVIVLARIVVRSIADLAGLFAPSATPPTRHRIGEPLEVRAGSVLGGSHHEHQSAPASA